MGKTVYRTFLSIAMLSAVSARTAPAPGFVDLALMDPKIRIEMRYSGDWNFTGRRVPGYRANKCYLTIEAARGLAQAQKALEKSGHSLLVFDCYRPERAVRAFVDWTRDETDQKMKSVFYPAEPKSTLVQRGYIADRSGHSRGSTVDLTLVSTSGSTPKSYREPVRDCRITRGIEKTGQLDLGTLHDCFSDRAATESGEISARARTNRNILRNAMEGAGFQNYSKEWWHYTLKNEPYPDRYFDFEVE